MVARAESVRGASLSQSLRSRGGAEAVTGRQAAREQTLLSDLDWKEGDGAVLTRPLFPRCPGMTSATFLVRSCTEVTSPTTGTAGCAGPTWGSTSEQKCWKGKCCWPPGFRSPQTWTIR